MKRTSSKPKFCDLMQGRNAGNARIESGSILASRCVATRVNAWVTQHNVRSSIMLWTRLYTHTHTHTHAHSFLLMHIFSTFKHTHRSSDTSQPRCDHSPHRCYSCYSSHCSHCTARCGLPVSTLTTPPSHTANWVSHFLMVIYVVKVDHTCTCMRPQFPKLSVLNMILCR